MSESTPLSRLQQDFSNLVEEYTAKKEEWNKHRHELTGKAYHFQRLLAECSRAAVPGIEGEDFELAERALGQVMMLRRDYEINTKKMKLMIQRHIETQMLLEKLSEEPA